MNDQIPDKSKVEVNNEGDRVRQQADKKSASENVSDEKQANRYQENFESYSDGTMAISPLILEDSTTGETFYNANSRGDKGEQSRRKGQSANLSFYPNLKDRETDEEAQGNFSIAYNERKASETLAAALQEPSTDQILIASNIAPNQPNLEQMQQRFDDVQNDSSYSQPDAIIAQDWGAFIKKGIERIGQAAQNPELHEGEEPPEGGDKIHPHRGREDESVDFNACANANKAFPGLKKHIGNDPGKIDSDLIAATIRNEQFYYTNIKDTGPDHYIRAHGNWPFAESESIGPAQMQVRNIKHLARCYPEQLGDVTDAVRNAEDLHRAPFFVGAYFEDVINGIETKQKPHYISENTWININKRWRSGERNEALIIAYNPDPKQIEHVLAQLKNIKEPD